MIGVRSSAARRNRAYWLAALLAAVVIDALFGTLACARGHEYVSAREPAMLVVADLRGQALLLVDPVRGAVVRRVAVPGGPHELALLPDGRVVTSLEQAGALAVVDLGSGLVETLAIGGLPHGIAVADGVLLFTDRERDEVRRLRLDDWADLAPLPAGHWPHALATLAHGDLVVANAGADTLTVGARTVAVSALPETVAVSPRGDRLATAGAAGNDVEVLGTDGTMQIRADVGGRPVRVVFDPAGAHVAAALSASASVALVDMRGAVRLVAVGGLPDGLAFDAAGRLYVSDLTSGRLTVIDVASGTVKAVYTGLGVSTGALLVLPGDVPLGSLAVPLVRQ